MVIFRILHTLKVSYLYNTAYSIIFASNFYHRYLLEVATTFYLRLE